MPRIRNEYHVTNTEIKCQCQSDVIFGIRHTTFRWCTHIPSVVNLGSTDMNRGGRTDKVTRWFLYTPPLPKNFIGGYKVYKEREDTKQRHGKKKIQRKDKDKVILIYPLALPQTFVCGGIKREKIPDNTMVKKYNGKTNNNNKTSRKI